MAEEIVNRVANSALVTLDLEAYYPAGERKTLDLSQWLYEGVVLKEKEFRAALKAFDFSIYNNAFVALHCSTDALLPAWAPLLVATSLEPYAQKTVWGTLETLPDLVAVFARYMTYSFPFCLNTFHDLKSFSKIF